MKSELVKIGTVKLSPDNPRIIKGEKFKKLVQSIKDFPQMLELRPIVVDNDMVVLGGNMRLRACIEAGLTEVPILIADKLTPEQQAEFMIKDNSSFGEWNWDTLANEWDIDKLELWGVDLPINADEIKETKDIPEIGEIEFSEDLMMEHNYIVLYFDNPMDWEVAKETYGLKEVKSKDSSDKTKKVGIGRVVNGKNFI